LLPLALGVFRFFAFFLGFGNFVLLSDEFVEFVVLVGLGSPRPPHDIQFGLRLGPLALAVLFRSARISQFAKLLAQILGLDATVGRAQTLLDGLRAVTTTGNDPGLLCDPVAGQGEVFGALDPLAQIKRLAFLRICRFGDLLVQGFAILKLRKAAYSAIAALAREA